MPRRARRSASGSWLVALPSDPGEKRATGHGPGSHRVGPVRALLPATGVECQRLPNDAVAGLRLAEPKAERPAPVVGKPRRSHGKQLRRAERGTDGGVEHRIAPREECVGRESHRHLRIDRDPRVVGSRHLPVDPRDAQLDARGGQQRVDGVPVEVGATTARLPHEDWVRHLARVRRRSSRLRKTSSAR